MGKYLMEFNLLQIQYFINVDMGKSYLLHFIYIECI